MTLIESHHHAVNRLEREAVTCRLTTTLLKMPFARSQSARKTGSSRVVSVLGNALRPFKVCLQRPSEINSIRLRG